MGTKRVCHDTWCYKTSHKGHSHHHDTLNQICSVAVYGKDGLSNLFCTSTRIISKKFSCMPLQTMNISIEMQVMESTNYMDCQKQTNYFWKQKLAANQM
jgi:hypothetical protein